MNTNINAHVGSNIATRLVTQNACRIHETLAEKRFWKLYNRSRTPPCRWSPRNRRCARQSEPSQAASGHPSRACCFWRSEPGELRAMIELSVLPAVIRSERAASSVCCHRCRPYSGTYRVLREKKSTKQNFYEITKNP